MRHIRTILAFLIAPVAIPVGYAALCVIFPGNSGGSLSDFFGLTFLFSLFALPPAYVFELVFGFPVWLFIRRRGVREWYVFAGGGIALGTAYWILFTIVAIIARMKGFDIYAHSFTRYWFNPMGLWLDVPAGLLSAVTFRAIIFPWCSRENPKPSAA